MGIYDILLDPATGEERQSKAFGRAMRTYRPGDEVRPHREPVTVADYADVEAGHWDPVVPGLASTTYQSCIAHTDGSPTYLDVADGLYTGVSSERDRSVSLIDHYGWLVDEDRGRPFDLSEEQ